MLKIVKGRKSNRSWIQLLTIIAITSTVVLPIAAIIMRSFSLKWFFPDIFPTSVGLSHWAYTFSSGARIMEALFNSVKLAVAVTFLAAVVGLPAARMLGLHDFKGKSIIQWVLMLPILIPPMVSTMGIYIIFLKLHLNGTFFGLTLVHLIPALPYFILVMSGIFSNYNSELEDTARTLGASQFQVFFWVTLPAISSGLSVACLFTFLISWSQYVTSLLIGGGSYLTLPLVLFPYLSGGNPGVAASITLIFIAPAILILILTSRTLGKSSDGLGGFGRL